MSVSQMNFNRTLSRSQLALTGILIALAAWLLPSSQASADPAWRLTATSMPTNFKAGGSLVGGGLGRNPQYSIVATNVGDEATSGEVKVVDTLPAGLTPEPFAALWRDPNNYSENSECAVAGQTVTCTITKVVKVERYIQVAIPVEVSALAPPSITNEATVEGGGAQTVAASTTTTISEAVAPFDFLAGDGGFNVASSEADGAAETQAGAHPHRFGVEFGLTTKVKSVPIQRTGTLKDFQIDLPPGLIVNPQSSRKLCTELQLQAFACPLESQVGLVTTTAVLGLGASPFAASLYNMVPPPGVPALLGFEGGGFGIFIHVEGAVRSGSDYGLSAVSANTYPFRQYLRVQTSLWGDPSDPSHDDRRGRCGQNEGLPLCSPTGKFSVEPHDTALVTMPSACSGPTTAKVSANSWEKPEVLREASSVSADLQGTPVGVEGCNALQFEPTIESKPTTNLVDSPSGLDFKLHQPQNFDPDGLSTPALKDAVVTLPAGMSVNPSSADGQEGCSTSEVGLMTPIGSKPIHFDEESDTCPDASKIGSVEVKTPLLGHTLPGAVYLAEPFQNPFNSLLAIYISVDDSKSGTVATLAGEVKADPSTGQLTTTFEENPQLPIEDIELQLFEGARAPLITPPTCGTHTTTSTLTPWSAPETPDATPSTSFNTTGIPGGGACPGTEGQAPNSPSFSAGTIAPQAGAFSPLVMKLSREDGSQRLKAVNVTMPPGLTGKLAGIPACSDASIKAAKARDDFNEGTLEIANPSCPAESLLGTVTVSAGAGPLPYHTQGKAYLAGPYQGAPLSVAIITPAVAGPFDLGVVAVRAALNVNPRSAQITAVSDPIPSILKGIPLDVRSAYVRLDRSQFTLNPTSCDPMQVNGEAISLLEQPAALTSPFQVGGCKSLAFKPKLNLRLFGGTKRGAHPKLRAILTAKPGEAGIRSASVALPRSEFLDQSHIRTVCTRVQFAADQCPEASIYGYVKATTPLLDETLEGPIYLRSSDNELPDVVGVLKGPASRPIEIEGVARIDSIKGGIRANLEGLPDAPITKVVIEMQGGRKGLLINSRNLCASVNRATVKMDGHNGRVHDFRPVLRNQCAKGRKAKRKK